MASGANEMSVLSAAELASSATAIFPSASPVTLASSGFLTDLVNSPPALSGPAAASLTIPSYV